MTREGLTEVLATAPLNGAALVRALIDRGVAETAVAGFFASEGHGPLVETSDLDAADPSLVARLPAKVLHELAALPLREESGQWLVAMLAPGDRHAVVELERLAERKVVARVARWSALEPALRRHCGPPPLTSPSTPSEPPVLELLRKRDSHVVDESDVDDAAPLLLVRTKPVVSQPPAPAAPRIVAKSFAAPERAARPRRETLPNEEPSSASTVIPELTDDAPPPTLPARLEQAPVDLKRRAIEAALASPDLPAPRVVRQRAPTPLEVATAAATEALTEWLASTPPEAPTVEESVESTDDASTNPHADPGTPSADTLPTEPAAAPAEFVQVETESTLDEALSRSESTRPAGRLLPAPTPVVSELSVMATSLAEAAAEGKWDLPPAQPTTIRERTVKATARGLAGLPKLRESGRAATADLGSVLASIRQSGDRDEVVRLALGGALSVARSAVFFALRKGVLKGWDGLGAGVSQDSARNLWIPTSTPSLFQRVVETGSPYLGPHGNGVADGLFRAAVGSRGGDLALHPIRVSGKIVGVLASDDVRGATQGQQRVEQLAQAIEEAFARIIVAQKS